jgi:hypothetical protein
MDSQHISNIICQEKQINNGHNDIHLDFPLELRVKVYLIDFLSLVETIMSN